MDNVAGMNVQVVNTQGMIAVQGMNIQDPITHEGDAPGMNHHDTRDHGIDVSENDPHPIPLLDHPNQHVDVTN